MVPNIIRAENSIRASYGGYLLPSIPIRGMRANWMIFDEVSDIDLDKAASLITDPKDKHFPDAIKIKFGPIDLNKYHWYYGSKIKTNISNIQYGFPERKIGWLRRIFIDNFVRIHI